MEAPKELPLRIFWWGSLVESLVVSGHLVGGSRLHYSASGMVGGFQVPNVASWIDA
jgi:hypothetical protein